MLNQKKTIHHIKHGRVHYRYVVGISWIQIETDPETDWPEMPDYMRVCFGIDNPKPEWAELKKPEFLVEGDISKQKKAYNREVFITEEVIIKAIKVKTNEQRQAHAATPGGNKPLAKRTNKPGQEAAMSNTGRKRRKAVAAMLPFESNDESAK